MCANKKIPCDVTIDNSLSMLLEGYSFIQNRCLRYKTDICKTRSVGRKATCMIGEEAAKIFMIITTLLGKTLHLREFRRH